MINLPSFVLVISTQKLELLSVNTGTSSISSDPSFVKRTLKKKEIVRKKNPFHEKKRFQEILK